MEFALFEILQENLTVHVTFVIRFKDGWWPPLVTRRLLTPFPTLSPLKQKGTKRNELFDPTSPSPLPFSPRDSPRVHFPSFHRATMERVEGGGRWRSLKRGETLFPPFPSAGNELLLWVDERGNKTIHQGKALYLPLPLHHTFSLSLCVTTIFRTWTSLGVFSLEKEFFAIFGRVRRECSIQVRRDNVGLETISLRGYSLFSSNYFNFLEERWKNVDLERNNVFFFFYLCYCCARKVEQLRLH